MIVEQWTCPVRLERAEPAASESIHYFRSKAWRLAICMCCELKAATDPDVAKVAEWLYPELGEHDAVLVREDLKRLIAADRHLGGDVEMHGFIEANPMLKGSTSPVAHGLYKLFVAMEYAEHLGEVSLSRGDCRDVLELLEFVQPALSEAGLSSQGAVGKDYCLFSEAVFAAVEAGFALKILAE